MAAPGDMRALQRAAGNQAVCRLLQRQPAPPPSFPLQASNKFLQITLTGRASARWRSAQNAGDADARNQTLSEQRADAVKQLVLEELHEKAPTVPVRVDVSTADDEQHTLIVGGHGEGSLEALGLHPGDRGPDEARERRVDIEAELVTTTHGVRTVSHPPVVEPRKTRDWELTITSFREIAVGAAVVDVELELRNTLSGRVATGHARLYGGGINIGSPSKSTRDLPGDSAVGEPNIKFRTDKPVGFAAFDTRLIRMGRVQAKLFVGRKYLELTFLGLTGPVKVQSSWSFGLKPALGSYLATGRLYLDGVPDDDDVTPVPADQIPYKQKSGLGEAAQVFFETGSATINADGRERIRELVDSWVARFN